jgi:uncharacterized protein YjbJ (UPF0337 family)
MLLRYINTRLPGTSFSWPPALSNPYAWARCHYAGDRRDGLAFVSKAMDKDRIQGAAKQVKGHVKEILRKFTSDLKTQEGKVENAASKAQNIVGGAKDSVRDALDPKKN